MTNPKLHKRVQAHQRYYTKDEVLVPGVTTICNLLGKPALYNWYNRLGLEGIVGSKYVDELADIGTLAHEYISYDLKGETPPDEMLDDYTKHQIDSAQPCIEKFNSWKLNNKLKPILIETGLISEKYKYGGTLDLYCELNGKKTLLDWKTGSGFYEGHKVQLAANKHLLEENGHKVEECRLLGIGRNEKEETHESLVNSMDLRFKKFLNLLEVYYINRELKV